MCRLQHKPPAFPVYVRTSVCAQLTSREINGPQREKETGEAAGGSC